MKHIKKSYLRVEKKLDNNFAFEAILTESSKAFGCIPQDLLIAKLPAYSFSDAKPRQSVPLKITHNQVEAIFRESFCC